MPKSLLQANALEYARLCGISLNLKTPLGHGNDGSVWKSSRQSAVKAFERQFNYLKELHCYQRLYENRVRLIQGHAIPQLMGSNDDLMVVEMQLVAPPFLLDFRKAYLDSAPEFSEEQMNDWEEQGQELFEGRWPDVRTIIWALKRYEIYYYDAKPGNIAFGDEDIL
jgi:hypothetical protein